MIMRENRRTADGNPFAPSVPRKGYRPAASIRTLLILVMAAALTMTFLAGCQDEPPEETAPPTKGNTLSETTPSSTVPSVTEALLPTSGNPDDVTCQNSYTALGNDAVRGAHKVVATVGDAELTNAHLQIYYWMAVNAYKQEGHKIAPDFSMPLDIQPCEIDDTAVTWQQYFLQRALDTWHSYQGLVLQSENTKLPTEEAYQPSSAKHEENLNPDIPQLNILYGYNTEYKIDDAHQAYLDSLPTVLNELAAKNGYESLSDFVHDLAGNGTSADYLLKYAQLCNKGYMFLTALSYYIEPGAADVEAFFEENETAYAAEGITRTSGKTVDLRHILLIPEGAEVAEDGTVTCSQNAWNTCHSSAKSLLNNWKNTGTETYFAELAFANSDDPGSSGSGGLYSGISKGQLTQALDEWCFDPERKPGDTTIIQTDAGYHILYFSGSTDNWYAQAEKDLFARLLGNQIAAAMNNYPMTVDYSAIRLGLPEGGNPTIRVGDLLYPDVAHERFPVAPLYFQQDYPNTNYGNYPLVTYGCGITTMSMLASYMLDTEWTPPEMCELYGSYCSDEGTAHSMFKEVPSDMGFYMIDRVYNWSEALEALEDGYMVVCLQHDGFWTRGGHYLLLHDLIEVDGDTKIHVRDSNLYNYKKLEGHTEGYFDLSTIPSHARSYWIYQKKVTQIPTCVRCGEAGEESRPMVMFAKDYYCSKCTTAMNRRDAYISACTGMN